MEEGERLLKLKEACERLGIHPNTLRRWERIGKIKVVRTKGGARRIPESEVVRLLKERASPPQPAPRPSVPESPMPAPAPPPETGITSPFSGGLILLGAALFLTCRLLLVSFDSLSFLFHYAVFIALTGSSLHLMKRGLMKGDKVAREGRYVLTVLLIFLCAFCGATGVLLCLTFSGWFSTLRLVLLVSWLLLLGILAEWKHRC